MVSNRDISLEEQILKLKKERNAIILAHNYQLSEVQDIETLEIVVGLEQQLKIIMKNRKWNGHKRDDHQMQG